MFLRVVLALCFIPAVGFAQTRSPASNADNLPRVNLSESAAASLLLKKVNPTYPVNAKRAGIEGDVVIRILIGADGRVTVLNVLSGRSALRDAAKKAVSQWQYETYDHKGQVAEVVALARVQFRLGKENAPAPP
jgi:TonB family protein